MIPRFGGGIGVTRMARAMTLAGIGPKAANTDFIKPQPINHIREQQL